MEFASIPEFFVEDVADFFVFLLQYGLSLTFSGTVLV